MNLNRPNEIAALEAVVEKIWYVRLNYNQSVMEFIPLTLGDYKLSDEELRSIGEVGYSLRLHPDLVESA